ncbi:MAG: hypothetical protein J6X33_00285 [Clostridiales bacterium]|nr:hypothetical protein [Clostridiales bacterium]
MTSEDLLKTMSYVDYDLIEELEQERNAPVKKPKISVLYIAAAGICAAVALAVGMAFFIRNRQVTTTVPVTTEDPNIAHDAALDPNERTYYPFNSAETEEETNVAYAQNGNGIYLGPAEISVGKVIYAMVDLNVRNKYHLLIEDEEDVITREDLGDLIGEVTDCKDPDMIGHKVYRRKNMPADDPIVIFALDEGAGNYEYYDMIFDGENYKADYYMFYGE